MQPHDQAFLEHHGILGMHWGVRKAEALSKKYKARDRKAANWENNERSKAATATKQSKVFLKSGSKFKSRVQQHKANVANDNADAVVIARKMDKELYEKKLQQIKDKADKTMMTSVNKEHLNYKYKYAMRAAVPAGILSAVLGFGLVGIGVNALGAGAVGSWIGNKRDKNTVRE